MVFDFLARLLANVLNFGSFTRVIYINIGRLGVDADTGTPLRSPFHHCDGSPGALFSAIDRKNERG